MVALAELFEPFPMLDTPQVTLRPLTQPDIPALTEIFAAGGLARYLGNPATAPDANTLLTLLQQVIVDRRGMRWGIERRADHALIGTCGFHQLVPEHFRAELSFDLHPTQGDPLLMQEALRAVIAFAFGKSDLHRIQALILPENTSAEQVLAGLGFADEGVLRDYEFFRSQFYSLRMVALLKGNGVA